METFRSSSGVFGADLLAGLESELSGIISHFEGIKIKFISPPVTFVFTLDHITCGEVVL